MLLLVLPCFGNVDGNPSGLVDIELRPAVVTGNLGRMLVRREGKANLEARWNLLRSRHRHEYGMEIGAIAAFRITGPQRVPVAPAGAAFVITHGAEDVLINRVCLVELRGRALGLLDRELCRQAAGGDEPVGL